MSPHFLGRNSGWRSGLARATLLRLSCENCETFLAALDRSNAHQQSPLMLRNETELTGQLDRTSWIKRSHSRQNQLRHFGHSNRPVVTTCCATGPDLDAPAFLARTGACDSVIGVVGNGKAATSKCIPHPLQAAGEFSVTLCETNVSSSTRRCSSDNRTHLLMETSW